MKKTKTTPHIFSTLDGIRGIAALFVFIRHFGILFGIPNGFAEGHLAVNLFFVLSGAVICHAYEQKLLNGMSFKQFAITRIIRIYPLYFIATALGLVLAVYNIGTPALIPDQHTALYFLFATFILPNIFCTENGIMQIFPLNGPSWSLFAEVYGNFYYALVVRYLTNRRAVGVMLFCLVGMIACVTVTRSHSLDLGWGYRNLIGGLFRFGHSFFAGVLVYRLFQKKGHITHKYGALVPPAVLLATVLILAAPVSPYVRPFYDVIMAAVVFPAMVYAGLSFQAPAVGAFTRACKFLGATSYTLYIVQGPIRELIQGVLWKMHGLPNADDSWQGLDYLGNHAPWLGIGLLVLVTILCTLLNKYFDVPVRKYLSSMPLIIRKAPR